MSMYAIPQYFMMCASVALGACVTGCNGANHERPAGSEPPPSVQPTDAPLAATEPPASAQSATPAPAPPEKLNVVAIFVDSLRADRMKWSGYERDVAPNLEAFAKTAVNYTNFYSASSFTAMSFGSFVGAKYPSELERSGYFFSAYPEEVVTFPELLQKAGIRTMAAHAHWYFSKEKAGFHQGFDVYELIEGLKKSNTTDQNVTSPDLLKLAEAQLGNADNTKGQFFAWYHFLDPHDEYVKHEGTPDFGTGSKNLYDGEVHFTDQHVGKLVEFIDAQPWGKRTAIIISADHGEAFGEHKMHRHGFELWDVLLRVPLLIRMPGGKAQSIDTARGGIDLPMTIMDMMGVPPDPSYQGVSLVAEITGKTKPAPRPVIADLPRTSDNDRRRALIDGDMKLIAYGDDDGYKLFNLKEDPGEEKEIRFKAKEDFARMEKLYKELSGKIKDVCPKINKLKGRKNSKPC